jgi:hypothetical protein
MKKDILKGNFKTAREVSADVGGEKTLEERFETEALKRLGGSIAFVSKKKVLWEVKGAGDPKHSDEGSSS